MAGQYDFELYKLLVEEVREARKARRQIANLFITLNIAGSSALGFLVNESDTPAALAAWMIVALVLTCFVWWISNAYYTRMLSVKYDVIYELEAGLGYDALQREWRGLSRRGPMRWFGLEKLMPILFIVGYVVFLSYQTTSQDLVEWFDSVVRGFTTLSDLFS
jgi:hypothetical protein